MLEELGQGSQEPDLQSGGPKEYAEWPEVSLPAPHHHGVGYAVLYRGMKRRILFLLCFLWCLCVHFRKPGHPSVVLDLLNR